MPDPKAVAAPAATPAASPATPVAGNPSPIQFDHEIGGGPDLLNDEAQPLQTQSDPASAGQPAKNSPDAPAPETPAADPAEGVLSYYEELAKGEAKPDDTKPEDKPTAAGGVFEKLSKIPVEQLTATLGALGLQPQEVAGILEMNTLVGRQSNELGQLRKTVQESGAMLQPILELDQSGKPVGFKPIPLLKMATEKFGPQHVNGQLEKGAGLLLVNAAHYRQLQNGGKAQDQRPAIIAAVAQEFGIDTTGLDVKEVRELIDTNPDAKDALTERLADARLNAMREQADRERQTEATTAQEREEITKLVTDYQKKIPHFAELEPVMASMYGELFANGKQPTKVQLTQLLKDAAEGRTFVSRLPKLIELRVKKAIAEEHARLGIRRPNAPQPQRQPVKVNTPNPEEYAEIGEDLVGAES